MWSLAIEKFGVPFLLGIAPIGEDLDALNKQIAKLKQFSYASIHQGFDVKPLEIGKGIGNQFKEKLNYHDMMIARSLLLPTLIYGNESEFGSRALGSTHFNFFLMSIMDRRRRVDEWFEKNIIRSFIDWNFKDVDVYPTFNREPLTNEETKALADLFTQLINAQIVAPSESWIRERLGLPEPEITQLPVPPTLGEQKQKKEEPPRPKPKLKIKENFPKIQRFLDAKETDLASKLYGYFDEVEKRLRKFIERATSIEQKETGYDIVRKITLDDSVLADLINSYNEEILNEVMDSTKDMLIDGGMNPIEKIKPTEAMNYLKAKNFTTAATTNQELLKNIQYSLINGLGAGKTIDDMMVGVSTIISDYAESNLEALVRTNLTDAYNQGRLEAFNQSDGFVKGVRFEAIIDDRTTPICRLLDGIVVSLGDPRLDLVTPPIWYNCRSVLSPVTIYDDVEPNLDTVWDKIQEILRSGEQPGMFGMEGKERCC
jgi:SPP1 gp7 family putative phage head morphogenesis protein